MKLERRQFVAKGLEVRAGKGHSMIAGHAAVFNSLSEDLGGYREQIAPGAFAAALGGDVRCLFNHDPNLLLGRTLSGTLRLAEDKIGLAIECDLPDTAQARDLMELMKRGDITQMSFGFRVLNDVWAMADGNPIRTLQAVELFDVSPVTFPAYPQTDVGMRGLAEILAEGRAKLDAPAIQGAHDLALRRKKLDLLASA